MQFTAPVVIPKLMTGITIQGDNAGLGRRQGKKTPKNAR